MITRTSIDPDVGMPLAELCATDRFHLADQVSSLVTTNTGVTTNECHVQASDVFSLPPDAAQDI